MSTDKLRAEAGRLHTQELRILTITPFIDWRIKEAATEELKRRGQYGEVVVGIEAEED